MKLIKSLHTGIHNCKVFLPSSKEKNAARLKTLYFSQQVEIIVQLQEEHFPSPFFFRYLYLLFLLCIPVILKIIITNFSTFSFQVLLIRQRNLRGIIKASMCLTWVGQALWTQQREPACAPAGCCSVSGIGNVTRDGESDEGRAVPQQRTQGALQVIRKAKTYFFSRNIADVRLNMNTEVTIKVLVYTLICLLLLQRCPLYTVLQQNAIMIFFHHLVCIRC